jgi:hypothetical protein
MENGGRSHTCILELIYSQFCKLGHYVLVNNFPSGLKRYSQGILKGGVSLYR